MTDRTIYQLERAMDALTLAIKYLKEDTQKNSVVQFDAFTDNYYTYLTGEHSDSEVKL